LVRLKLVFHSTSLSASSGGVLVHFLGGEGGVVVGVRRDGRSGVRADGGVNWTGGGGSGTLGAGRATVGSGGGDFPATGRDNGTVALLLTLAEQQVPA
jgi:hypothetical protein